MPQDTNPFAQWAPETLSRGARLLPAVGEGANPFAQWAPSGPAAITEEPEEEMGEFAKGVGGGVDFFQSTMGVLGIAMGRVFGSEEMEDYGEELRSRNIEEGKQYQAKVSRVEDIRSISDGFDYAAFTLGHLLPSIGASVVGGAVGTIAGGAMGLAPGAVAGGLAGAFAPSLLLNGGEVYNDLREKGVDSFEAAATAGIPMALLDMFVPGRVAGKLVWKPSKKALTTAKKAAKPPRKFGKRLRQETLQTAGVESGTEGLQETIALAVETDVTGEKFVTNENLSRILNGAVAGLLGGGVVGPLAALRADPTPIEEATEEELADAAAGGGEPPPGGGAAAPVAEAGVDPTTGLPIVPEPIVSELPVGLPEEQAPPSVSALSQQGEAPGAPTPAPVPAVEVPDIAPAPTEAATEPSVVSEAVPQEPAGLPTTPAETEAPAPEVEAVEETEEGWEKATTRATEFVRAKDGGKVTASMLAKQFKLNKAQAKRLHGHLRSKGILTQKGYAHKKITKPRDVMDIIMAMGGVKPDSDLRGMEIKRPGFLNKNGVSLDDIGVHLEALGILEEGWDHKDVMFEIDRAWRKEEGRPFHPEDEDLVRAQQTEEAEDQNQRALDDASVVIEDSGIDLTEDETKQVMDRVRNGENAEDALEAALILTADQETLDATSAEEEIPFDETAATEAHPSKEGKGTPREGKKAARPARAKKKDVEDGEQPVEAGQVQEKEDLLEIPGFLKRKVGEKQPAPPVAEPLTTPMPKAPKRQKKRKTKEQKASLRKLGYPNAAIVRLTEAEATVAIGKSKKYVRTRKKKGEVGEKRLFVPLATEPYRWFESGAKTWELRALRGQYNEKNLQVGRHVELRRGYSTQDSIFGTLAEVKQAPSIGTFFREHGWKDVIPSAANLEDAISNAAAILRVNPESAPVIAFRVEKAKTAPTTEPTKQEMVRQADLENIEIEYPVTIEETNETVIVKTKAATALKSVDARISSLQGLVDCLS